MGIVNLEEIGGFEIGNEKICFDCMGDEEFIQLKENHIITRTEIENAIPDWYFCDRCKIILL
ncbi:hypothetical protein ACFL2E_03020 [Thermodesulfobacteriota bacterium]